MTVPTLFPSRPHGSSIPPLRPRRPGRALLLLAALLPAALLLGGAAAAQAPRSKAAQTEVDPLVAKVNGRALHLSDVHASIESLSLGDQIEVRGQLGTYIEAVINEEVLFQWALRTDFAGAPELRKEIKDLVVRHLIDKHVRSRIRVTEADARAYYDANPSLVRGEHVRVRRILLPTRPQCERLKSEIQDENDFIEAARKYSLDASTREEGGDVGLMMRGEGERQGHELEYFDMRPGEMRIFDDPRGCMLVRSVYYVNPPLPPFSAVRDDLMQYLRNRQEVRLVGRLFERASGAARVERFYRRMPAADPAELPAAASRAEAPAAGSPAAPALPPAESASRPAAGPSGGSSR